MNKEFNNDFDDKYNNFNSTTFDDYTNGDMQFMIGIVLFISFFPSISSCFKKL